MKVPTSANIDRVVLITVDCLRWEFSEQYQELYPDGVWFQATPQATYTPVSHASLWTGLNPPRHGMLSFGMDTTKDTFINKTNSVTSSGTETGIFSEPFRLADNTVDQIAFESFIDKEPLQPYLDKYDGQPADLLEEYDLTWLHDWVVHGTGIGYEQSWTAGVDKDNYPENAAAYQEMVDHSINAHKILLNHLKEEGLYENTLFVVWGDHGQSMFEPSYGCTMHCHYPEDGVARTPIAFLSEQFDGKHIDRETNARSVDVVPTLYSLFEAAGLPYERLSHETEGVDLTEFEGRLAAYSLSGMTRSTGGDDGLKGNEWTYLAAASESLARYTPDSETDIQEVYDIDEKPELYSKYRKLYNEVRQSKNRLILENYDN